MVVLSPFGVPEGSASAQSTIDNIAEASWVFGGTVSGTESNIVSIPVEDSTPIISTFHQVRDGSFDLSYYAPVCAVNAGRQAAPQNAAQVTSTVSRTSVITAGEDLIFRVDAASANLDSQRVESLQATLRTSSGDSEQITIYETGPNTGQFVGRIPTIRNVGQPARDDCRLSLDDGNTIEISVTRPGQTAVIVSADVDVLADPFGVVFDSETGEPVTGAVVSLVDARTGQPAVVFGPDGVTPWPSTVISGEPVTDAAGNVVQMGPGEYWFPFTSLGQYRLTIEPPAPYTAPSIVTPGQLAMLTRPDGRAFVILDASYGGEFTLTDPTPVQIDIPLDRPSLSVSLTKTASRQTAEPGDVVFYTIEVRNQDATRAKRDVTLVDTPSPWLRLRRDSIRIDGQSSPDAIEIAPDGSLLTIALGDIAGNATRRVVYAMTVRPDAAPGLAENQVQATDSLGRTSFATASVDIERDTIAGRMTIIGRITAGPCSVDDPRVGIPGVRVMMEDGSFAISDADGRYHFEGVVPGTHVVQAAGMTLPEGAEFVDCHRSTRNAGSASSRFVTGWGGSLMVADFHAVVPLEYMELITAEAPSDDPAFTAEPVTGNLGADTTASTTGSTDGAVGEPARAPRTNWLALGDGPDGWLSPELDHNPRAPAVHAAIRHRQGTTVTLMVDGNPVEPLAFEGTRNAVEGDYAVSLWRNVTLSDERTVLTARFVNSEGQVADTIERVVYFTSTPARVQFLPDHSSLIADGRTRPVVAIRVLDHNGRPLREGVSGEFTIASPYQSAEQLERQQLDQLTGIGQTSSARWLVTGNEGIARIELAPTMVSGSLRLDFRFDDGEIARDQAVEAWIEPGDIEWTIIGLAEGSIGARTVADNMERSGRFDSDLGDNARVALYAKGRVLGRYLVTVAYDSADQRDDQRLLGTIDPNAYYTVFADASSRRFDAASREKLYVRIETSSFYALYGDFETGFNETRLARYNRTATGVTGEARIGQFGVQAFAAEIGTRFRRDEIQGQGISGPYSLSSRRLVANSEQVVIETRDRFRSELVVESRTLTRFIDYDIDLLSGTISFKQPILSRDVNLNPQFIVIDYEIDELGDGELNAGLRIDWTSDDGDLRIGATAVTDKGDGPRTEMGGIDLRARIGTATEIRAEAALSRSQGDTATGWSVELQHQTNALDILAYAQSLDGEFGVGQQNGVELGRRKFGFDGRLRLDEHFSILGSAWQDDAIDDDSRRRAVQVQLGYQSQDTDLTVGIAYFDDRLADGTRNRSTVLEGGVTHRLLDNDLEVSATSSLALDATESIDLPARHRLAARYAITDNVRLVGLYEIAEGENVEARTIRGGFEIVPWQGGQITSSLGQQRIDEFGNRSFAAFGLAQTLQVSPELSIDATIDGSHTLGGSPDVSDVVNPLHPVSGGGQFGPGGALFEDFTAVTLGAAWRRDRWSATARGEYRDGEFADRTGFTFGAIRQLGEGSVVGSGFTWTEADGENGATSEIFDAALAYAHRPDDSEFAMLGKLEYRSDEVTGAVFGETGAAGRTALTVNGDAVSRRLIASVSTNWSPRGWEEDENGVDQQVRRDEFGLFVAVRHNFDEFEGFDLSGTSLLAGAEARIGIGDRVEVGAMGTVRTNLDDNVTSFAVGPQIGFVPADGVLLTLGYNIEGFRDEDFSAARNTDRGVYAAVRMKFDADTFSFLGLGR